MLYQNQINRTIIGSRSTINRLRSEIDQSRILITIGRHTYFENSTLSLKHTRKWHVDKCQHTFRLSYKKALF